MAQELVVGVLVAAACFWLLWTLVLPRAVTDRVRRMAGRDVPPAAGGACGACGGCGARGRSHVTACRTAPADVARQAPAARTTP